MPHSTLPCLYCLNTSDRLGAVMKILLWAILIIFIIGLLVVTGVFKMIF
ncbi:small membrane protein YohP [Buttiauxella warmboldiae]